jgi:aminoglycoside/choline kinase family phosphotransferase
MGWELEKSTRFAEPEVKRWGEASAAPKNEDHDSNQEIEIFNLSGGVMKSRAQTANRIDGLLVRMLENPSSCKYVKDIDRNLDYLFTHLQLDMIARVAKDTASKEEIRIEEEQPDPALSLDRMRISV